MASTRGKGTPGMIGGIIIGGGYLFLLLEIFVFTYFLPAIEMEYLDSLDMTSGLKLRKLWRRAFSDPIDYLLFFLFHYLINSVIAPLGILLCFIGIYATAPWGMFTDGILFGRYLAKKDQAKHRHRHTNNQETDAVQRIGHCDRFQSTKYGID